MLPLIARLIRAETPGGDGTVQIVSTTIPRAALSIKRRLRMR